MNLRSKKNNRILFFYFSLSCFLYSQNDTIRVINYNIHGLPPIFTKDKNSNRVKSIFENVSKKYDLILFQENWVYQNLLSDYFHDYKIIIGNETKFIKKNNPKRSTGLNILANSSIKIKEYKQSLFNTCSGWFKNGNDCFASKGFMYSKLELNGHRLNLFLTHLDAGYSLDDIIAREQQISRLEKEINKINMNEPIIICGDFNINYYTDSNLIDDFRAKNNLEILRWDQKTNASEMIDFIFLRHGNDTEINLIDYGIDDSLFLYSDHPPIYFSFLLNKRGSQ